MTLNDTFIALINKVTRRQVFIIAIIVSVIAGTYYVGPPIIQYIENAEIRKAERYLRELELENNYQKKLDSIEKERKIEQSELFILKNSQINDLMSFLERRLPRSSHVTVYSIHNGGGVPKTGGEAKISVLYTTDNVKGVDILREYDNYPLYSGYAEYAYQMMVARGRGYYVKNVADYPAIYEGETKNNMDVLGTKSTYGVWIKTSTTATYYIVVSFPEVDGMSYGGYGYKEVMILNARDKLIKLIDTTKEID